ncbi:MAG: DegT/DnrJ/EryC1/StrS family aminotransferase [Chloroflexota bacterium]|nr:DegT/DnrJ/EryC1/StrS family aminotransferase [Chloroflexota bacterium]
MTLDDPTALICTQAQRRHSVLVGRAATGIYAALYAFGLQGKLVGIPANTCYVVLWAVLHAGCRPVLLDIDPLTGNLPLEPQTNGELLSAIIPCHMYGITAPLAAICCWAKTQGVIVIEDAALAYGAIADGKPAGAWGDVSVYSFGAGKIVDNGVGGAVLTNDMRLAAEIERVVATLPEWDNYFIEGTNQWNAVYWALHQYEDKNPKLSALYPALYEAYRELVVYRLDAEDLEGLITRLSEATADRERRIEVASRLDAAFEGLPVSTLPRQEGDTLWKYPLLVDARVRDDVLSALWEHGVHEATRWYPSLRYMTAALSPEVMQPMTPNADMFAAQIINLPLSSSTVVQTSEVLSDWFA